MGHNFIFTLHIEQTESADYWGYIAEMPHLSRVVGKSLFEVGSQLVVQLAYLSDEMPASWHIEVRTEFVFPLPLSAA